MNVVRVILFAVIVADLTISAGWTAGAGTIGKLRDNDPQVVGTEPNPAFVAQLPIQQVDLYDHPLQDRIITLSSLARPFEPGESGDKGEHIPWFWVIDTRSIPTSALKNPTEALAGLRFFTVDETGAVRKLRSDDWVERIERGQPLWVVVHGNRVDSHEAFAFMMSFCRMSRQIGLDGTFVLWSWPSGVMVRGIARDSRLKAMRADLESSALASWLASHSLRGPVNLVGYSFGARTVMQAVWQITMQRSVAASELLEMDAPSQDRPAFTLFLIAPAMDTAAFDRMIQETVQANPSLRVFVTVNRLDPALRWYRHLWSYHGPSALGWQGPFCHTQKDLVDSLDVLDVTRQVGHTHRWETYLTAPALRRAFQRTGGTLLTPSPPQSAASFRP